MINVTDTVKKAYEESTTQYDKIILDNEEYYINNVQYCDDCYLDGNIFGTAIARTLDFEIENNVDLEKKEFKYLTGVETENGIEWISLGNFITQEIETDELGNTMTVNAMDYMLKTNVEYTSDLKYSNNNITLGQVAQEACNKAGITLATTDFANIDFIVDSNQFAEGTLIREVIQAIAQISGTFAKIRSDNKLYFITPKRTGLTVRDVHTMLVKNLDKLKLKYLVGNKNKIKLSDYSELSLKRNTHPINLVSLGMSDVEGENVVMRDEQSILFDGENSLVINDNPFAYTQAKREQLITALFNTVKGFKYTAFEIKGQSKPWIETGDEVTVVNTDKTYSYSFLFRFNYKSRNGLESEMSAPSIIKATVAYQNVLSAEEIAKRTELIVDKQEQTITGIIEQNSEFENKLTKVEQDIDSINQEVKNIQDFEREITERNEVHLNETILGEGYVLNLKIKGSTENFKYLAPSSTLAPNSTLAPYGDHITLIADKRGRTAPTEEAKEIDIRLEEPLRNLEDVYDELNIADGKCIVTRRIGVDENLELYVLETEGIEEIGYIYIPTFEGNTYLYIKEYYNLEYTAKYIKENEYSEVFATNVELNSKIEQTSESIKQEVNKKVGKEEFGTLIEQNAEAVKYAWNQISEYLQMEVLKGNVSLVVRGENQKLLMSLDKNGQNFYKDNEELLGEMGIQRVDETDYVAFSVPSDYNQTIESGMAWGLTTTSDNKFHPILYVKNFAIENEQSDAWYGQIVLQNSDLVLASLESGIVIGNVRIYGNFLNGIVFEDINTGIVILNINPSNNAMPGYQNGQINILDKISFYANQAGSNTMKIGAEEHYCLMTDNGYLSCDELYAENEISCNTLRAFGHIYCNNGVEPFSLSEKKRNIQKYNNKAIEEVKKTDIFYYNYKEDKENCKKRVGAVIGSDYNCSEEIIATEGKGIDLYSMISVAYKALQEQQEIIEKQEERITKLEGVINKEKSSV